MKLFILTKPPKDDILEVLPFILGRSVIATIEKYIKYGKLILNGGDNTEMELF